MVRMTHWDPGSELILDTPGGQRQAIVQQAFWN
jgi:dimethylsulfoniopropionate demethylase